MKVLVLFNGVFPGPSAGAKRVDYYRRGLENEGLEVKVLAVQNKKVNRFSFFTSMISIPVKSFITFYRERKKQEVLFLYGFGWLSYILLSLLAKISGVKIYIEVNEKPGSVYGNRMTELKIIKSFNLFITELSYYFLDGFVVISTPLEDYIKKFAAKKARIIKIPIIIDLDRNIANISKPEAQFPYLLHTGALSDRKDGIIEVFEAFAKANSILDKKLHFYLTSKIAPQDVLRKMEKIIKENKLQDNVHFLGNISEEMLLSYQKYCSMVIINKHLNEQNLYNFPTKLGEYLVFEIPVITTSIGEMGNYLIDDVNCYFFPVNNVEILAKKMISIIENPEQSKQIGSNGKEIAAVHFNYIYQGKRFAEFLLN
jgi:glycosyltransferase involved in cell wall biosynthesis